MASIPLTEARAKLSDYALGALCGGQCFEQQRLAHMRASLERAAKRGALAIDYDRLWRAAVKKHRSPYAYG